jgi:hypothetical protein
METPRLPPGHPSIIAEGAKVQRARSPPVDMPGHSKPPATREMQLLLKKK